MKGRRQVLIYKRKENDMNDLIKTILSDDDVYNFELIDLYSEYSDFIRTYITNMMLEQGIIVTDIDTHNVRRNGDKCEISGKLTTEKYDIDILTIEDVYLRRINDFHIFRIDVMSFEDWFNIINRVQIREERLKKLGI